MRRVSQSLLAMSLLLVAGCQKTPQQSANSNAMQMPEKSTPEQPVEPTIPAPKLNTLAEANNYIHDYIANRNLSDEIRGQNTDYFINHVNEAIWPQLEIGKVADLYEGLTDCLEKWSSPRLRKPAQRTGMYEYHVADLVTLGEKYDGRFLQDFARISMTRIPSDAAMEKRIRHAIQKSFSDSEQQRLFKQYEKISLKIIQNPELAYDPAIQKSYAAAVGELGSGFASAIYGKKLHFAAHIQESPDLNVAMRFDYDLKTFNIMPRAIAVGFENPHSPLPVNLELVFHESSHAALNEILQDDPNPKSPFLRIVKVNRNFQHLHLVAQHMPGIDPGKVYLSVPEERAVYRYGDLFFQDYEARHPNKIDAELKQFRNELRSSNGPAFP